MHSSSPLQISCIGNGTMSQSIQKIARERGHSIQSIICRGQSAKEADGTTVIECALPEGFTDRFKALCARKKDIVIVTTGWYDQLEEVRSIALSNGNRVIWSSNFSIGVQLYFRLIRHAASLINAFDEYDIWATDLHHKNKVDAPSGTAWTLGRILLDHIDRKTQIVSETLHRKIKDNEIHFSSTRGGYNNFKHVIAMGSPHDIIEITHRANNREGYALGAIQAAEWLARQEPGFYDMEDYLRPFFNE